MTWIPFHSSLREGDKRGLPRAVRFIYLELSMLTRPTGGRMALPRGFRSDVDAIHDSLGGNRREIELALKLLTVPLDPTDPSDLPMLLLSGPPERRVLELPTHRLWVKPDTSAERVDRWRKTRREGSHIDGSVGNVTSSVTKRSRSVSCNALEERRGEESKGEQTEETKETAADAAPVVTHERSNTDPPPTPPGTLPLTLEPGASTAKSPEADVFDHWVSGWKRIVRGTRVPALDQKRRGKIRARLAEKFSVADLKRAIDGMWATPWNLENKHYDIELVCRDAPHVERFMANAPTPEAPPFEPPPKVYGPAVPPTPEQLAMLLRLTGPAHDEPRFDGGGL